MHFRTAAGERDLPALVRDGDGLLVGLDFDGTLAPIVDDPTTARIHPDAAEVLIALARSARVVAVITGRPARQVLALGGLDEIGDLIGESGHELVVLGQYGNERWSSTSRRIVSPKPPSGLAGLLAALPRLLRSAEAEDAYVEEKGLAVAVHTRRSAEPREMFDRLLPILTEAAREHGLVLEPGRLVIEIRSSGMDKGQALRSLVEEYGARSVAFIGDDLGDLPAFEVVADYRASGLPTLLVCSGSDEESALRPLADVVVDGPDGVLELLRELDGHLRAARS